MVQTIDGTVLVLPPYAAPPLALEVLPQPEAYDESESVSVVQPRPAAPAKIMSLRCGKPVTLTIPSGKTLADVEASPCE